MEFESKRPYILKFDKISAGTARGHNKENEKSELKTADRVVQLNISKILAFSTDNQKRKVMGFPKHY